LSNVSFTERMAQLGNRLSVVPASQAVCEEEKGLTEKLSEWNTVETSEALFDEDDNIFHPDDEIIVDPKESLEPIKRVLPLSYGVDE